MKYDDMVETCRFHNSVFISVRIRENISQIYYGNIKEIPHNYHGNIMELSQILAIFFNIIDLSGFLQVLKNKGFLKITNLKLDQLKKFFLILHLYIKIEF